MNPNPGNGSTENKELEWTENFKMKRIEKRDWNEPRISGWNEPKKRIELNRKFKDERIEKRNWNEPRIPGWNEPKKELKWAENFKMKRTEKTNWNELRRKMKWTERHAMANKLTRDIQRAQRTRVDDEADIKTHFFGALEEELERNPINRRVDEWPTNRR